ncbi:MAG TPA: ribosome silencing factor [Gammaproteobacteria bacterium]|nr:ribosome silencing factor [Gammaproteobacteria bacterium]
MNAEQLQSVVTEALEDLKAVDIVVLDVRGMTTVTDYMVIASGTSDRHVKALLNNVVEKVKSRGVRPLGVEGERDAQWGLVDLGDVVVHIMLPQVRDFYQLEKLWRVGEASSDGGAAGA